MDILINELTKTKAKIRFTNTTPYIINSIRRIMLTEVPKMAIDDVEFHLGPIRDEHGKDYESVSPLYDEILAHRLGLLPVPTDLDLFTFRDKCTCKGEGCPSCTIMYTINKKGPCTVYSGDLEPLGDRSKFAIVDDLIPIVKLAEGQAPLIYATAVLGTPKQHAKFMAVSGLGYKFRTTVEVTKSCTGCGECVSKCPASILKIDNKKLVVLDSDRCKFCKTCVETCRYGGIKVSDDPTDITMKYETDGSLTAKRLMSEALKILESKFESFKDSLSSLEELSN
ncbi:MAG: DNA-directed RNA polymerase subunit D [Thermoplasmata archaeon]